MGKKSVTNQSNVFIVVFLSESRKQKIFVNEYALTSILNRVLANESIYAIKELREMTNLGLKEAKDLCDTIKAFKESTV